MTVVSTFTCTSLSSSCVACTLSCSSIHCLLDTTASLPSPSVFSCNALLGFVVQTGICNSTVFYLTRSFIRKNVYATSSRCSRSGTPGLPLFSFHLSHDRLNSRVALRCSLNRPILIHIINSIHFVLIKRLVDSFGLGARCMVRAELRWAGFGGGAGAFSAAASHSGPWIFADMSVILAKSR
ncbi:hypothetical protein BZA70DRAFT_182687 [Myxozyma melibiosi]|uniref:Secreted protein n=1 Tax=Myxozyma melibiosi TaxID=54550 RepID=A0ABR1F4F9_9ASCO